MDDCADVLKWLFNLNTGILTSSLAYLQQSEEIIFNPLWWNYTLWSLKIPLKLKNFQWLGLDNHLLAWDNLLRWGVISPNYCSLCGSNEETIFHIFATCPLTKEVWKMVNQVLNRLIWGILCQIATSPGNDMRLPGILCLASLHGKSG